jgi:hypothetical protein
VRSEEEDNNGYERNINIRKAAKQQTSIKKKSSSYWFGFGCLWWGDVCVHF